MERTHLTALKARLCGLNTIKEKTGKITRAREPCEMCRGEMRSSGIETRHPSSSPVEGAGRARVSAPPGCSVMPWWRRGSYSSSQLSKLNQSF